jgi:hypothetical protein
MIAASTAALGLAAAPADAKTTVSAAYGQVGSRTLSVYTLVTGAPRGSIAVLETKRFSRSRAGRARTQSRRLPRSGRVTLRVGAPRAAKRITARVRVVKRTKRKGRTRTRTVATGRWTTMTFSRAGRTASIGAVKSREIVALTPPSDTAPGTVQLSGSSARVRTGQVIALGITPATPDGLLAQVTHIERRPGAATATLAPARLSDVVPAGALDIDIPIEPVAGISASKTSDKTPRALECTSSRSATATALAELSAGVTLSAKWTGGSVFPPKLPKLQANVTARAQARLEGDIVLDGEAKCNLRPQTLFPVPVRLAAFTVQVGPVPVPIVIDGQVTLTGSAEATGSLATGVKARATIQAGATYDNGRFTPNRSFERSFVHQPPTVNGSGTAQVALSPSVNVRLAGAAGPEVDFTGGLKLSGNLRAPVGEPWWRLTAPLSLGARFKFALWGINATSERFELWGEEPVIAQADPSTGPPGSTITDHGTSPEPLPPGVRTRLTWDSDTDVDLHTWNQWGAHAYFRDLYAIDGGYLDRDVIPGYGPETFYETDPSLGNQFTFGVCQYSGYNANVTVDVRDPNGHTRRYTVALRGEKAAALLTTSPPGTAPYIDPDADWCSDGSDPTQLGQVTTGSFD